MGRVNNKVIVITGAASGIGEACAILMAEEGALVALADLNEEKGRFLTQKDEVQNVNVKGVFSA